MGTTWGFILGQRLPESFTRRNVLVDVDGDGDLDVLEAFSDGSSDLSGRGVRVWTNDGAGQLSVISTFLTPVAAVFQGIAAADINADGDIEILLSFPTGTASWRHTDGVFVRTGEYGPEPDRFDGIGLALGDLNGDGWLDLLSTTSGVNLSSGAFQVAFGNGAGNLETIRQEEAMVDGALDIRLGDFDGDGDLDAVALGVRGRDNTILINNPAPSVE